MSDRSDEETPELDGPHSVASIEIGDIRTFDLICRRRDAGHEDVSPVGEGDVEAGIEQLQMYFQETRESVALRAVVEGANDELTFRVDMAVAYRKLRNFKVAPDAQKYVVQHLALPNLYPYLRAEVHETTSRLGSPVLLPLIRIGDESVQAAPSDDADPGRT